MKIWIIKHKGKTWWGNMLHSEMEFGDGYKCLIQYCFYRKKDARKYLIMMEFPEYYEIVGCEVPKSKQDNRKRI